MKLDRTVAPLARPIRQVSVLEAETTQLSNGTAVHMIRSGKQPVIGIEIIFRHAGLRNEEQNGVAFFTNKMLAEGTQNRNSRNISSEVDKCGAYLQLSPGLDFSSIDLYTLTKFAKQLLNVLSELVTESTFPETELQKLKDIQQQQIKLNNQKTGVLASKAVRASLFGENHPYGKSLTAEAIEKIDSKSLRNFFRSHIKHQIEIIVAGDISTEVLQALEDSFGSLPKVSTPKKENTLSKPKLPKSRNILITRPDNLQSSIRIATPLFNKAHADFHKMRVVNTILGGYFGSRLMRNIREEKGLTYGINSGVVALKDAGYFIVGTDAKKEYTIQVIDEIHKEIKRLQELPVPDEELITVKNYMAGRLLSSVDTPFALAEKFKNIYLYDLTYDYYKDYLNTVNLMTAEEVLETSQKYLDRGSMVEVVVGEHLSA